MINGLGSSLSGLIAYAKQIEVSSNNLANLQTAGFKSRRADQQSLEQGGVKIASVTISKEAGGLLQTGNPLDISILGQGFFSHFLPSGKTGYSRNGSFSVNGQGQLTDANGNSLQPPITFPGNATGISIDKSGMVSAIVGGTATTLGQINLSVFSNPDGLTSAGGNIFLQSEASGSPKTGAPGTAGRGELLSGFLESSNVDIVREIVNMMAAGNGFKASIKAIIAQDEMTGMVLNMKA